ncbi:23S rRNA (pseudouridine1915-N3)-methyltransferase [Alteromonadaceae bacterium Bs31]|nr:23S rRNA (pseudouridine1915-N3)-methyltransferase [Alteromonadaceae bacterium Bs31]
MKLHIISVGGKMPAWVQQGYGEYAKRMPRELQPNLLELPLANRSKNANTQVLKAAEAESISSALASLPGQLRLIALDVKGKALSTEGLAEKMSYWQMEGLSPCLIIGGPDGLDQSVLRRADEKWSLSGLTLPHPLVRVLMMEQLYRAWTITQNHPYHK